MVQKTCQFCAPSALLGGGRGEVVEWILQNTAWAPQRRESGVRGSCFFMRKRVDSRRRSIEPSRGPVAMRVQRSSFVETSKIVHASHEHRGAFAFAAAEQRWLLIRVSLLFVGLVAG